jgi:hypothetical protein
MKRKAINFYGSFEGLYDWGRGWISREAMGKWDYWWKYEFPKMGTIHWKEYIPSYDSGACGSLLGLGKAIYLHPMAIYGTFVESGCSCACYIDGERYKFVFYNELKELNKICKAVAEYCGAEFHMDTTREFDIEEPEERIEFAEKRDDYITKCCEKVAR